ncbi:hypothetical protein [Terrabacter terrigena]|uniref:Uncharacterized protein n=1 Tax=Terrabacter terrigena TaxID=574718 RepID=A0ABW3N0T3_9MICO
MHVPKPLTAEESSRLAVTATVTDLEYWAHHVAAEGKLDVLDLLRVLDAIRESSVPQSAGQPADLTILAG